MSTTKCPSCGVPTLSKSEWRSLPRIVRADLSGEMACQVAGDGSCNRCHRRRKVAGYSSPPQRHPQIESAMAAVTREYPDCIIWAGRYDRNGYGKFGTKWAHRLIYELSVGPIPVGLELDHLCRNPACVNPRHLEPVTHAENMRRAGAAITHCPQGHEFTAENTYLGRIRGERKCRACNRERARARWANTRNEGAS